MHVITITNIDHNLLEVEVSVDVYKVYEDSRRQEERQRYEYRKHINGCGKYRPFCKIFHRSNVSDLFCILPTVTLTRKLPKCRGVIRRLSCVPLNLH